MSASPNVLLLARLGADSLKYPLRLLKFGFPGSYAGYEDAFFYAKGAYQVIILSAHLNDAVTIDLFLVRIFWIRVSCDAKASQSLEIGHLVQEHLVEKISRHLSFDQRCVQANHHKSPKRKRKRKRKAGYETPTPHGLASLSPERYVSHSTAIVKTRITL